MCRFLGVLVWFRYLHQCDQWSKVAMENPRFQLDTSSVDCTAYYTPISRINLGVTLQYMCVCVCVYIYIWRPPEKIGKEPSLKMANHFYESSSGLQQNLLGELG